MILIENYQDYFIQEDGQVWSEARGGRMLKPATSTAGYQHIILHKEKSQRTMTIHRLVAKAFIPNPHNHPCVNHIDGDKSNNNVRNLEWCSYSENTLHAIELGLQAQGSKSTSSKLTDVQVLEIRQKYTPRQYTQTMLAKEYLVSPSVISKIIQRKTYKESTT